MLWDTTIYILLFAFIRQLFDVLCNGLETITNQIFFFELEPNFKFYGAKKWLKYMWSKTPLTPRPRPRREMLFKMASEWLIYIEAKRPTDCL